MQVKGHGNRVGGCVQESEEGEGEQEVGRMKKQLHLHSLQDRNGTGGKQRDPGCREKEEEDSSQICHLLLGHHPGSRAFSPSTQQSPFWLPSPGE